MQRRDFLSLCGLAAGSCLVPDTIARVIRYTCILAREPYLILPRNPKDTLYAYSNNGKVDFIFYLGDPTEEEKTPTWREYFDEHRSAGALGEPETALQLEIDTASSCAPQGWSRQRTSTSRGCGTRRARRKALRESTLRLLSGGHRGDPSRFQLSCLLDCRLPTLISPTGDPAARLGLPRVRVRVITHAQAHLDI